MKHDDVIVDSQGDIIARLVRALLHQVRGDLSVITNDLVYVSSLIDPHEVQRPRERCAHISQLVGRLGVLSQRSPKRAITGRELLSLLHVEDNESFFCRDLLKVDSELVGHAAELLVQLLGGVRSTSVASPHDDAAFEVCIRGVAPCTLRATYRSASSFALQELGERAVIDGCIVDLIFRDHEWQLQIEAAEDGPLVRLLIRAVM